MNSMIKRFILVSTIIAMFAVATAHIPLVYSSESTADDKLSQFLSNVVELDLTKYNLVPTSLPPGVDPSNLSESLQSPNVTLNDQFGGLVDEEVLTPELEYNENKMDVMGIFYNGHMAFLKIYSQDDYVYSKSQPTDILNQTKSIIQRYQTFTSQNYAKGTSYLAPLQNILNSVNDLSPTDVTDGNVNFQVSQNGDKTLIQWIYTENGVSMNWKRVSIKFRNNTFVSFWDTWGLYSVSGPSEISSEEAVQIAFEAAQNYKFHISNQIDNETRTIKAPDLSDAPYDVSFTMVPFRFEDYHIPSNMSRDPLMLYPYWAVHFYFNESIGGNVGIQVGVWGDTGEILYCSGFGYYGVPVTLNEQDSVILPSDDQPSGGQKQPNPSNLSTLAIAVSLAAIPLISISAIALRHKKRHQ